MDAESVSHTQSVDDLASTLKSFGLSDVPQQPNTHPEINPVDIYRSHITELLQPIAGVDAKIIYPAIQWPSTLDKGDLVLPVPALRLKGKKPDEVAKELAEKFPESPLVQKPQVEGSYLRFFFQPQPLTKLLVPSILRNGQSFGFNTYLGLRDPTNAQSGRKKLICEFSSPNIAKPFHVGHLRSTIIGGFLSNLYAAAGWEVIRMNYLGDWGKQYGILAIGYERFGNEEALLADPINHLFDVYVKVNNVAREEEEAWKPLEEEIKVLQAKNEDITEQTVKLQSMKDEGIDEQARKYFKRMVDGDPDALAIWKRFRDLSIERYKQTYARLNIRYDEYSGESMVKEESMDEAARIMQEKKVSEDSQGAVIVDLTKYNKKLGKAIVKKKDGTSLYLTRDIGEMWQRHEKYGFDKMIYVVASQQDLHLAQLFKIVEIMGREEVSKKCLHINFGMVLGMSTRKGTVKFLDDILADVAEKMHDVMRSNEGKYAQVDDPVKTADILGISAVMVQDMTGRRINNYTFDLNRMTSFEGDTGPYLQYAHARLTSIMRKAQLDFTSPSTLSTLAHTADLSLLTEKHAIDLIRALAQWPDVFLTTYKTLEPITVLTYLFKMTHALSSSYDHLQVVGSEEKLLKARLALYASARVVLGNGMRLLGLTPLERM